MSDPALGAHLSWTPIFVLPNLVLTDSIDGEYICFAPHADDRVQKYATKHPIVGKFLSSFHDAFGVAVNPSVLLLRDDAPDGSATAEAIAGFRDAVVTAAVPLTRARWMTAGTVFRGAYFANAFEFHPWSVGRDNQHLVSSTLAQEAMHQVDKFKGQPDPSMGVASVGSYDLDKPLLEVLLRRWQARFNNKKPERRDVALFRSLGIANEAMRITGGVAVQIYDIGRLTGLWTSAFETLFHPGGTAVIKERQVREMLGNLSWQRRDLRHRRYLLRAGSEPLKQGAKAIKVSLPELVYFQLNDARNAFMHGNDVSARTLSLRPRGQSLGNLASLLFRMAVADHAGAIWDEAMPPFSDVERWAEWFGRHSDFMGAQHAIEDALCIAQIPPGRDGETREAIRSKIKSKAKRHTRSR